MKSLAELEETLREYHKRTGATHYHSSKSVLPILMDIKRRMRDEDQCFLSKAHAVTAYMLIFEKLPEKPPTSGPFCSLGMALPFAIGVAIAKPDSTIYVVCGDGELQEGANLEALYAIPRLGIKNLEVWVDDNGQQAMMFTPPLVLPKMRWIKTYKGLHWDCHYKNPE